jgi:hypothetical protein
LLTPDEQVKRALELTPKGGGNYEYFFQKFTDPEWIRPLAAHGRFLHPPHIEQIGEMFRMPRWPEGEYLLRMASEAHEAVAAAITPVCFESDNPLTTHQLLLEIAAQLPTRLARDIAMREIT